jgi:hypothetical protein
VQAINTKTSAATGAVMRLAIVHTPPSAFARAGFERGSPQGGVIGEKRADVTSDEKAVAGDELFARCGQ